MRKALNISIFILIGGMVIVLVLNYFKPLQIIIPNFQSNSFSKIGQVLSLIKTNYHDTKKVDSLEETFIRDLLQKLDPHSNYLNPQQLATFTESMEGYFGGIGIEYIIFQDSLVVTNTIKDKYAYQSGILKGDRIVKIDSLWVSNISKQEVSKYIKGPIATTVSLGIKRKLEDSLRFINVTRGIISIPSVDRGFKINKHTAFVRINTFGTNTAQEFKTLMDTLSPGIQTFILDLRNNTGGSMKSCLQIADYLLPKDSIILQIYEQGKHSLIRSKYPIKYKFKKMWLLVNEWSASASEILAGTLQDNQIATVVGQNTFGKGMIQTDFDLSDGSVLRLTTATYKTPKGNPIQKTYQNLSSPQMYYTQKVDENHKFGIAPDIEIPANTYNFLENLSPKIYETLIKEVYKYADNNFWQLDSQLIEKLSLKSIDLAMIKLDAQSKKNIEGQIKFFLSKYNNTSSSHFFMWRYDPILLWMQKHLLL